jgi:hypothetical protein
MVKGWLPRGILLCGKKAANESGDFERLGARQNKTARLLSQTGGNVAFRQMGAFALGQSLDQWP